MFRLLHSFFIVFSRTVIRVCFNTTFPIFYIYVFSEEPQQGSLTKWMARERGGGSGGRKGVREEGGETVAGGEGF